MSEDVGAQLRKGVVEPCILGLLAREPMYGWQLSEQLVAHGMIASIGTLYPILGRLRAQGLVSSFDEASPAGPVRKFYELTDAGWQRLSAFRRQWEPFSATVLQLVGPTDPSKDDTDD